MSAAFAADTGREPRRPICPCPGQRGTCGMVIVSNDYSGLGEAYQSKSKTISCLALAVMMVGWRQRPEERAERGVMPSTTTNLCQAKASYKKAPGLLELTPTHLQWTPTGKQAPSIRVPQSQAACQYFSPPPSTCSHSGLQRSSAARKVLRRLN